MANAASRKEEASPPTFGISRQRTARLEIVFALKNGALLTVYHDVREPVTEETAAAFAKELSEQVAGDPQPRVFQDEWSASGQRAWVNLAEVVGFSLRPAR